MLIRKTKNGLYYDKNKHKEYMKRHRQYKQTLYLTQKLTIENN